MKSRTLARITAIVLFAELAIPVGLAAQEQQAQQSVRLQHYTVTDLGTLGGTSSEGVGINNQGSIAGSARLIGDTEFHAVLWREGVRTDLGTLGGPNSAAPEASPQPNLVGDVAGASDTSTPDPNGEDFCAFGTQLVCLPFVWQNGLLRALPTLGGNNGEAWQITNRGQVPGVAENAIQDPTCTAFNLEAKPVLWERGNVQELPTVSGDLDGVALAVNDGGQAVGESGSCFAYSIFLPSHAVLWPGGPTGGVVDLGNLGSTMFNVAFGINNRGQVVGQSGLSGKAAFHAFLWQQGVMTDLGTLPGDVVSWAETINNKGQAVGTSFDVNSDMHPFIWQNGVMTDLNTLIASGSPWLLLEALGNNDRGQIVGYAFNTITTETHGYLLTPVEGGENLSPAAAPSETKPRSPVVLPENIRKLLQQRHGFGRFTRQLP
jgi:probable HAF family extracellular repeat protein